jgi:hypothetical protein
LDPARIPAVMDGLRPQAAAAEPVLAREAQAAPLARPAEEIRPFWATRVGRLTLAGGAAVTAASAVADYHMVTLTVIAMLMALDLFLTLRRERRASRAKNRKVTVKKKDAETRCAFCHDGLAGEATSKCAGCGTIMHADCAGELGRCPTLGCSGKPRPAPEEPDPSFDRDEYRPFNRYGLR